MLIYFYPLLPELVPEYLNLDGEVIVWGRKGFASVFPLPVIQLWQQVGLCFSGLLDLFALADVLADAKFIAAAVATERLRLPFPIRT